MGERAEGRLGQLTLLLVLGCTGAKPASTAGLDFVAKDAPKKVLSLGELQAIAPPETLSVFDPYYNRKKTFRALPLAPLLEKGFGRDKVALARSEFLLRATDGYTVPITGSRLLEPGAYVAFEDTEVPGWEPIGPSRANPGPFYMVWRGEDQADPTKHPRPWQLKTIELAAFEDVYPHTVPTGAGEAAQRGFAIFKVQCIVCHAINREGGRVGPDLNVPKSVREYRDAEYLTAYIPNPWSFRYGNMPPQPQLSSADVGDLIAYFDAMKDRKNDPDAGKVGAH